MNILLNAIQAMEGGGKLRVSLDNRVDRQGVELRVSDTGEGIAAELLPQVFSPPSKEGPASNRTDDGQHLPHRVLQAHQHRPADHSMADAQFIDEGQGGDGMDVAVIEAMAGVDPQP
jgi:hypothetical protein